MLNYDSLQNNETVFLSVTSVTVIERFWKELKDWLSDYNPKTMAEVSELVVKGLKSFSEKAMSSITSFEYLMTAWLSAIA